MDVALAPLVAESEAKLKFGAETAYGPPSDRTGRSQVFGGVPPPRHPGYRQLLPAVAGCVEGERVEVNLPSSGVSHHETSRKAWLSPLVVVEALFFQRPTRNVELTVVEREVEVAVLARLSAGERVHSPTTVYP